MRAAVVGVGAAGLATAISLTERGPDSLDLTLFDPLFRDPERSARGLAYQSDNAEPLLNAPTSMMSVHTDDAGDFTRWVRGAGIAMDGFVSRPVFGTYLSDRLEALRRQWVGRPGTLHCVPAQASCIERSDGRLFSVGTDVATFDYFDSIFLCTGWGRGAAQPQTGGGLPAYPLDDLLLRALGTSHIGVIGTGLTAVDVARALLSSGYGGRITLASRRGLLPGPRTCGDIVPSIMTRQRLATLDALDLRGFFRLIECEADFHHVDLGTPKRLLQGELTPLQSLQLDIGPGPSWRNLFVALCDEIMADAWNLMSLPDRRLYLRWLHPYFQSWCNPMPPVTAKALAAAMESGQLEVRGGLRRASDKLMVFADGATVDVDLLISAQRSGTDSVSDAHSSLVQNLVNSGLAEKDSFGGLRVNYGTWQLLGPGDVPVPIYAIGSLAQGARYYVNALDSIMRTIPEAVSHALRDQGSRLADS